MSALSDIIALLDRWPKWKAISESPDRIAALEQRVAELESRLQQKALKPSGPACPICGEAMKTVKVCPDPTFGDLGVQQHSLQCTCGHNETRQVEPK